MKECPFKEGDIVRFNPSQHSKGWVPHRAGSGFIDNETYKILRIVDGKYIYTSPEQTNGWHWKDFEFIEKGA